MGLEAGEVQILLTPFLLLKNTETPAPSPARTDISSEYDSSGLKAILSFALTQAQMLDH